MEVDVEIDESVFLPVYRPLLDSEVDIEILYGSRDTGKSQFVAQSLIKESLEKDFMRCLLIRKTLNTIKDSQFQTIKDIAEEWKVDSLFTFKESVPSRIEVENGANFYARGMDNPQKVKSFRNPTHAWVEEFNELEEDDWILLITSLRSNISRVKIWATMNPMPPAGTDYRNFFIYKYFFEGRTEKTFTGVKKVKTPRGDFEIKYRCTHATYLDNPFCDPLRMAIYEDLKTTSPYHYRINALGEWTNRENKAPFMLTFNREKHLRPTKHNPELPLYLSFDFNRNPMCCSVIQWDGYNKVDWIEVIKIPNSTVYQVCDVIKIKYPDDLYIVCGDGSGRNESALVKEQDLNNYYKVIKQELNLTQGQLQYVVNPPLENNQVLMNYCFQHLDISINEDTCQPVIFDLEFAEVGADGKLRKRDREDPAQQLDALDTARYFFNRYFSHMYPID